MLATALQRLFTDSVQATIAAPFEFIDSAVVKAFVRVIADEADQ